MARINMQSRQVAFNNSLSSWTEVAPQQNGRDYILIINSSHYDAWLNFNDPQAETDSISLPAGTCIEFADPGIKSPIFARSKGLIGGIMEIVEED